MSTSLTPLFAFIGVIALIPLVLLAMKRAGLAGGGTHGQVLKAVAQLPLGGTQRVSVIEVAVGTQRHWLVLGVSGHQVQTLASYLAPDVLPTPAAPAHNALVDQLIHRWRQDPDQ